MNFNSISHGFAEGVGKVSAHIKEYVGGQVEKKRDEKMSLFPPPPVSKAGLGGKIINGVFATTAAPIIAIGYAPYAAYKNSLLNHAVNLPNDVQAAQTNKNELKPLQLNDLINFSESESKAGLDYMMKMPESELKDVVEFMINLPELERKEVLQFAVRLFEGMDAPPKPAALIRILAEIPSNEREAVTQLAESLIKDQMYSDERTRIVSSVKDIDEAGRLNFAENVNSLSTESMNGYAKVKLINIFKGVPDGERENLVAYAFKQRPEDSSSAFFFPFLLNNQKYQESLLTPEHREAFLKFCEEKLNDQNISKEDRGVIASFVYSNRAALELDEFHPLIQDAYIQIPNQSPELKLNYLDSKHLNVADTKADSIAKRQLEEWNKLKNEGARIEKIKVNDLGLEGEKEIIALRSASVTEQEAIAFQDALGTSEKPGEIGKFIYVPGVFNRVSGENKTLENGNILYAGEHAAINLYTSPHYLLLNGTLDNDQSSINDWKDMCRKGGKDATDEYLAEAQQHVMQIAELATSGINKLPPYEGMLYRGTAMTNEKLEEYRQGTVIMTKKFFSCSTNVDVCEKFAKNNASEYKRDTNIDHKPVLYVFKSESSKDIQDLSQVKSEEERVYPPGQGFRSVTVDEKSIPGLAIIYMEEMK